MSVVVVLFAFGHFVATLRGGLTAPRVRDYLELVLGLAAGLMVGIVALDPVPEALFQQPGSVFGVPSPLLAFVLGFLMLHIIERTLGIVVAVGASRHE
jgi:zinc transporter ZupT